MYYMNFYIVFLFEVQGEVLGAIDRTVLTAGTAESDLQMLEAAFHEPLHMMIHETIDGLEERQYLAVVLQKINDRLVQARHLLVLLVLAGVMG